MPLNPTRRYFDRIARQPCWHATAEYGTWLSLNFGQPKLVIREGNPSSKSELMRRRKVTVQGDGLLWVEMGAWELREGRRRLFHSEQSRSFLRRAAARLDGQILVRLEVQTSPLRSTFSFDHGSVLSVWAHETNEDDDPLWHIYGGRGCLSLLAGGKVEYGHGNSQSPRRVAASSVACAA